MARREEVSTPSAETEIGGLGIDWVAPSQSWLAFTQTARSNCKWVLMTDLYKKAVFELVCAAGLQQHQLDRLGCARSDHRSPGLSNTIPISRS